MACPACGCKVHYQHCAADFGPDDERLERCAACSAVFDIEDAADDGDEDATPPNASGCDFCRNPLFAGTKCKNCGRTALIVTGDLEADRAQLDGSRGVWDGSRACPNCDAPPGQQHGSTCPRGVPLPPGGQHG